MTIIKPYTICSTAYNILGDYVTETAAGHTRDISRLLAHTHVCEGRLTNILVEGKVA